MWPHCATMKRSRGTHRRHSASRFDAQVQLKDHFIHRNHQCIVFELLADNLYELIKKTEFQASAAHKQKNARCDPRTHAHTEDARAQACTQTRFSQALLACVGCHFVPHQPHCVSSTRCDHEGVCGTEPLFWHLGPPMMRRPQGLSLNLVRKFAVQILMCLYALSQSQVDGTQSAHSRPAAALRFDRNRRAG